MPIARKIDKDTLKDFSSQMKTNFTKTTVAVEEEPQVRASVVNAVPEPVEEPADVCTFVCDVLTVSATLGSSSTTTVVFLRFVFT